MSKRTKPKTEDPANFPKQLFVTLANPGSTDEWWHGVKSMDDIEVDRNCEELVGVYELKAVNSATVQVVSRPKVT